MSRRRGLTPEDRSLWSRVAATAAPLHPGRRQPVAVPTPSPPTAPRRLAPPEAPTFELRPFRVGETALRPGTTASLAGSPAEVLARHPVRMDAKAYKRMNRGRLAPEARLDLHGMTLAAAQPELTRFILDSHAAGRRLVLVITGKGKSGGRDAPLPVRPGALRHHVPHWLHLPPLAGVVLQVTAAHHRHGGEGAYYVYLRRRVG